MQITKFVPAPKEAVFRAFTNARELEKWCSPTGLSLKVDIFEAQEGGKYRYIYDGDGISYECSGHFEEFIPNERLAFLGEKVTDSHDKTLFKDLHGTVSFRDKIGGSEITITQSGFLDDEAEGQCEEGWVDCLMNLPSFLMQAKNENPRPLGGENVESR